MSNRTPATHQVMMYGAPSAPMEPWPDTTPQFPFPPPLYEPLPNTSGTKIAVTAVEESTPKHVRVVTRKETDGTLKLKVYVDGELQAEVESNGTTLNAEFDL